MLVGGDFGTDFVILSFFQSLDENVVIRRFRKTRTDTSLVAIFLIAVLFPPFDNRVFLIASCHVSVAASFSQRCINTSQNRDDKTNTHTLLSLLILLVLASIVIFKK